MNRQILRYFKPKRFEYFRGKTIYDFIGITIYKRYLPTTGDMVRNWRKIKQIKITGKDKFQELIAYERKTRNYEWRHIIGAIVFIILSFFIERKFSVSDWIILCFLNLYINIYPIFLQRYNRIRIIKVLKSFGQSDPYEADQKKM